MPDSVALPDIAAAKPKLGSQLAQLRALRGASLRSAADAAGISSAYLLKLERNEVQTPSPHVLQRLADHYRVSYVGLMELAGYRTHDTARDAPIRTGVLADALAAEPLTDDEQRMVVAVLSSIRTNRVNRSD